jgi:hypothetical protein
MLWLRWLLLVLVPVKVRETSRPSGNVDCRIAIDADDLPLLYVAIPLPLTGDDPGNAIGTRTLIESGLSYRKHVFGAVIKLGDIADVLG